MSETEICPICGQEVEAGGADDATKNMDFCDECQLYVCTDCYSHIDRMCISCVEEQEAQGTV